MSTPTHFPKFKLEEYIANTRTFFNLNYPVPVVLVWSVIADYGKSLKGYKLKVRYETPQNTGQEPELSGARLQQWKGERGRGA